MADVNVTPTADLYAQLQGLADHFNRALFAGTLPATVITLQRGANTAGYFSESRWLHVSGASVSELALNPAFFATRPLIALCQTVVHELCHLWQHIDGSASRPGYHNAIWADKMEEMGLMPSATGRPGGARIGQKMADFPMQGGQFLAACDDMINGGFALKWIDCGQRVVAHRSAVDHLEGILPGELLVPIGTFFPNFNLPSLDGSARKRKTKYKCPSCEAKVWGKQGLSVVCGDCGDEFEEVGTPSVGRSDGAELRLSHRK